MQCTNRNGLEHLPGFNVTQLRYQISFPSESAMSDLVERMFDNDTVLLGRVAKKREQINAVL